ncbi:phosphonate ABC transporter, permease protein PhnE [Tumebacillus permanentifrigoris]|uniref:Phosphonate transport system permease protein n=1 Tax=Tumebacillus permanentifrigoris TaxID=378543 RepID=A0A316DBA4_9BACL|nr:phosphonate ABC transporter, permease protein PhnE [Tumebacillus permanentifrigoris]PWK11314.1 phosphonate transport system permease protein [Tumebacillus permanentifrigoris]
MNQSNAFKLPPKPSRLKFIVIYLILAVLYVVSYIGIKADITELWEGLPNMGNLLAQMFPPDFAYFKSILKPMMETLKMAILGTVLGSLLAIPFTLLAARNVFLSRWITSSTRFVLNFIRTIPDLLLASIFVAIAGLGPLAGVCALVFFSFGIVTKMTYESVETIDPGPLEAMTAVGANKLQFIGFAVVPQALPAFVAYVLYTFEVCVRASAILGLVGAGGIGMVLKTNLDLFNYPHVTTIILFTLLLVIIIDSVSASIRERLL